MDDPFRLYFPFLIPSVCVKISNYQLGSTQSDASFEVNVTAGIFCPKHSYELNHKNTLLHLSFIYSQSIGGRVFYCFA